MAFWSLVDNCCSSHDDFVGHFTAMFDIYLTKKKTNVHQRAFDANREGRHAHFPESGESVASSFGNHPGTGGTVVAFFTFASSSHGVAAEVGGASSSVQCSKMKLPSILHSIRGERDKRKIVRRKKLVRKHLRRSWRKA